MSPLKQRVWEEFSTELKPSILSHEFEDDGIQVRAECISGDWSLAHLYTQEDAGSELGERVARELAERDIDRAYAPSVAHMSAYIAHPDELVDHIELPYGMELWRNKALPSDGIMLDPREAMIMGGGGCPVAIATGYGKCSVSHVGRDSALDRGRIVNETPRRHFSVIQAMAEVLGEPNFNVRLRCLFAISREVFDHSYEHPEYGDYNKRMAEFAKHHFGPETIVGKDHVVYLDMERLVLNQARLCGFTAVEVADMLLPIHSSFGHTRHPDASMRPMRNLVIVHRLR